LNIARNEANPDDKKIQKQIAKTEKKIDKAEIAFAKRMKKDSQKKRFFKEDREMQN
jgi:outer membrane protein assembly factor BamD